MKMLKEDNTLSSLNIQKKLINKGVNMSTSTIRRALKKKKYTYKIPNIAAMILTSIQMKARKCLKKIDLNKTCFWNWN